MALQIQGGRAGFMGVVQGSSLTRAWFIALLVILKIRTISQQMTPHFNFALAPQSM
jgi:hypothetical protein